MLLLFHPEIFMFRNWPHEYTHTPVQSHVYKEIHIHLTGCAYCFSIAAMTKYDKVSHIKHPLIISQYHGLEVSMQVWFSWVLCLGSHQAEIKSSAGLCYFLEGSVGQSSPELIQVVGRIKFASRPLSSSKPHGMSLCLRFLFCSCFLLLRAHETK